MAHIVATYFEIGCSLAMIIGILGQLFLITRIKLDIIHNTKVVPEQARDMYNYWKVLRMHKSVFPTSRTRLLFWVSQLIFFLALLMLLVQIATTHFWHNNLLNLFPAGR